MVRASSVRHVILVCCVVMGITACERERAPNGITCDKLRALRIGMSAGEVRALVGSPIHDYRRDEHTTLGGPKGTDMQWDWMDGSNGVRLYLYFGRGRLLDAESWIRTMRRDLFDNESRPELLSLTPEGRREGSDFERIYCPEGLPST